MADRASRTRSAGTWAVAAAVAMVVAGASTAQRSSAIQEIARGIVFHDLDGDGVRDEGEPGVGGAQVSNGVDVVRADERGVYELVLNSFGTVFVIAPPGFAAPVDPGSMLPRFAYLHRPWGSPADLEFAGVPATGPLPASVDFALVARDDEGPFRVLVFGDPQPRNMLEIDYFRRDLIEPMLGESVSAGCAFGLTLGDIVFDNLMLFGPHNAQVARLGIPWHNVIGNHDINTGQADLLDDETFERVYGPSTYAFWHGQTLFILLDNIHSRGPEAGGGWEQRLGPARLEFVRNMVRGVPGESLIVAAAHAPVGSNRDRAELFAALALGEDGRAVAGRRVLFLTAHYHQHYHGFFGAGDGWPGDEPLHEVVHVTACGSWWGGEKDARGIPRATMACGAPNGYSLIDFDGRDYRISYRAASEPESYQMDIDFPAQLGAGALGSSLLRVNIFNGTPRSVVTAVLEDASGARVGGCTLERDASRRHEWSGSFQVVEDLAAAAAAADRAEHGVELTLRVLAADAAFGVVGGQRVIRVLPDGRGGR